MSLATFDLQLVPYESAADNEMPELPRPPTPTEIASANLADPYRSSNGKPLGPQESRWNFPKVRSSPFA